VLEMPYVNGALAMTLVLPDAVDGLPAVEARLAPGVYDRWMGALSLAEVSVSLPRLELAPAESLSLADTLSAMGMPLAFDRAGADFTGMAQPLGPDDRLYIAGVFHKAFLKLDEKGTEAAAATAVISDPVGNGGSHPEPKEFKANHPFLFFLRDTRTDLVLFMGRVADPSAK
jgi:serpin B